MGDPILVQGDTYPPIKSTITKSDGTVQDLTNATVKFQLRKENDKVYTVNAAATVLAATAGTVQYLLGTNDLTIPGDYLIQWEVTFSVGSGSRIQTTAVPNPVTVRRA